MTAIFISLLALLAWAVLAACGALAVRALGRRDRRPLRALSLALAGAMAYQMWFYFPRQDPFPAADYGPVADIQLAGQGSLTPSAALSADLLAACGEITYSRRALPALTGRTRGAPDLYLSFSGRGGDWSQTVLGCGEGPYARHDYLRKNGQYARLLRSGGTYERLLAAIRAAGEWPEKVYPWKGGEGP